MGIIAAMVLGFLSGILAVTILFVAYLMGFILNPVIVFLVSILFVFLVVKSVK